jgi:hypothetical protein
VSVWLKDLNKVLKKAGVPVIQEKYTHGPYNGKTWKTVGFNGQGYRDFKFILWHHDASPQGDSPGALEWMKYMEIAPAGTGGNDPGKRGNTWGVPVDGMNAVALGIETDHTYGERWTGAKKQAQLNSLRRGTAAIMLAYDLNPKPGLMRHLDWTNGLIDGNGKFVTYGRKNDVDGLDLADERRRVKRIMAALSASEDPATVTTEEAMGKQPQSLLRRLFRRADA